jgi:hypothetical protein
MYNFTNYSSKTKYKAEAEKLKQSRQVLKFIIMKKFIFFSLLNFLLV